MLFLLKQLAIFLDIARHQLLQHLRRKLVCLRRHRRQIVKTRIHAFAFYRLARRTLHAIIGATDSRNVALHGILQDLLCVRMHHPLEVVAVDAIES